jgi:5-methyltetrahydropteroyltriglutamate--homocysteine methyltransferase
MKRSTDRILTTHVGSLPRPESLVRVMFAKEEGAPVEAVARKPAIAAAVTDSVGKQRAQGVDLVSDGEMSKPSYATYVKDRLTGFDGESSPLVYQDLEGFPGMKARVFGDRGRARRKTPAITGPIKPRDGRAVADDIANLKTALAAAGHGEGFLTAASPGVVTLFFHDAYYKSHEACLAAVADAMRPEYEAIADAGLTVQIDCPDLAMGRHIQFADLDVKGFRTMAALHVEALNHATANIPPERMRLHLCWGNYDGPHHCDVDLADIVDVVLGARPAAISLEAANPRHAHEWEVWESTKLPEGKALIPGVIESKSNFIEHPDLIAQRLKTYARLVGRENVIAGSDCGYGTWVGQSAVDSDIVWAKLAALAEGARRASTALWG